ncbi:tyrosinase family protein [Streptomyces sp. NPDC052109]|uniref:tyrosinase family protein n=1 Tax=Streptomyces sp. NPDC052109 TaxID=3155527 RepID=UPI0034445E4A
MHLYITHHAPDGERRLRTRHMAPSFLPWHRKLLLEPERALRRVGPRIVVRHERLPPWDVTPAELEDMSRIYRYE